MAISVDEYRKTLLEERHSNKQEHSEHDLQVACVRWFRLAYRKYARLLMSIPNGGLRNRRVAADMKKEGLVAGVPDIFLAIAKHGYHGLWIEMKNGKAGRLSDNQKIMIPLLEEQKYKCIVCRDFETFKTTIDEYMKD